MSIKEKMNAALERANAGRQAKFTVKSEVAASQGKYKKAAKLEGKSLKTALRGENRQQRQDLKASKDSAKLRGKSLEKNDKFLGKKTNWSGALLNEAIPKYPKAKKQ